MDLDHRYVDDHNNHAALCLIRSIHEVYDPLENSSCSNHRGKIFTNTIITLDVICTTKFEINLQIISFSINI